MTRIGTRPTCVMTREQQLRSNPHRCVCVRACACRHVYPSSFHKYRFHSSTWETRSFLNSIIYTHDGNGFQGIILQERCPRPLNAWTDSHPIILPISLANFNRKAAGNHPISIHVEFLLLFGKVLISGSLVSWGCGPRFLASMQITNIIITANPGLIRFQGIPNFCVTAYVVPSHFLN